MKKVSKYPPHSYRENTDVGKAIKKKVQKTLFEDRENADELPHHERLEEKKMYAVISSGDVAAVDARIHALNQSGSDIIVGYLSDSPLRQARYLFVSAITIYTRAAMDGGVPEEIAYNISDSYIQAADQLTDPDEITLLTLHAMKEFTQAVADCIYRDCSPVIRSCCAYIQAHLHEVISLQNLSDTYHRSRNYVSDLFEQELGQRPMQYIRTQKLQAACDLLETTDLPVADIATTLAFPSHSSFSGYFAAQYGMAPLTWRRRKK